jgi:hypothetical protein
MPTYKFYDQPSGIEWEEFMSNSERETFLAKNKQVVQIPTAPAIVGDHIMGVGPKVDGGFTENMQRIAEAHPNSPLADKFGGNTLSHKEIKTRDVVNKHANRIKK